MKASIVRGTLCVALAIPVLVLATAAPSLAKTSRHKAAAPTITCSLSGSGTISPGIGQKAAAQTITSSTKFSGCTSSIKGITGSSASTTTTHEKPLDCSDLTKTGVTKSTSTIDWNNGTTSTESVSTTEPAGTESGKITSGEFNKDTVSGTVTYVPNAGFCSGTTTLNAITISGSITIS